MVVEQTEISVCCWSRKTWRSLRDLGQANNGIGDGHVERRSGIRRKKSIPLFLPSLFFKEIRESQ